MYRNLSAAVATIVLLPALTGCNDAAPVDTRIAGPAEAPVATAQTATVGPIFRRQVNDDYASFYGSSYDETSGTWVSVWVGRGGSGPGAEAWLSFYGNRCVLTGSEWWEWECDWFDGWGTIPAQDVSGNFQSGLRLHTDLRTNPNFFVWGAEPGIVSVAWEPSGWYESRQSGSWEFRWMHYLAREAGTRRTASADASGELLGIELPRDGSGDLRSGRGIQLEFERARSAR